MNLKRKLGLASLALCFAVDVLAQPNPGGYQLSWGTQGVPLSPWASAVIALMLVFAAYAFLRKRAGRALMMLAGALLVGGLGILAQDRAMAGIAVTDLITMPAGSMTLICTGPRGVGTTVSGGVTLTVTPISPQLPPGPGECATGTHLNPGNVCYLYCGLYS